MASEIKVDTVSEKTSGSGVTIDGLLIKDGGISGDVSLIGTTPTFTIGDAGAEDAALVFDGNAQDFYIALDDSADDLVIGKGSAVGTTPAVSIDENLQVIVHDNLSLLSDSSVLKFGTDGDTTLTHTDGTGLTLNSTNKICFNDASQFVQGSSATVLSIGATDEIDLTATAIDINGTCDISGTFSLAGTNVTATAAEINYSDLATLGTTAASKVFTADANNLTAISGAVVLTEDTLSFDATQDWDVRASPVAKVTLTANVTFDAPSNPTTGQYISIVCIQDGTGSRTIAWNAVFEFKDDTAPTATTTASKGDLFTFRYNGSKWLEVGRNLNLTLS
jgi:hypothetical protein